MDKIKNLHSVSSVYFFVLAFAYIFMVLAFRNQFMADFCLAMMRLLDIPFAFVSLLYGFSTLTLQISIGKDDEIGLSPWILIIFVFCLILFSGVVFINFAFPARF